MFDIITIGDSILDTFLILDDTTSNCTLTRDKKLLCFNYAEKSAITQTAQSVGGNAANIAVGISKLGLKTSIVTELGDDINGQIIQEAFEKAHVDTRFVKIIKNADTRYSVVLNYQTERTILSYHAKRKYTLPKLSETKWIYYTSLSKNSATLQKQLKKYLTHNPNVQLAFNPGSYQIQSSLADIKDILKKTTILFVNKEEAAKIVGKKQAIKTLLSSLYNMGAKLVVITDSAQGSYAFDGKHKYSMPIYDITPLAKTGAGDAYASGFLSALIYGKNLPEAMQWGTANAGGVITEFGAQKGLLNKNKLRALIKKYQKIQPQNM